MAVPFKRIDQYVGKRGEFNYPEDQVDPELKKGKDYYLAFNQALLSDFVNNACYIPYTFAPGSRTFKELHEYATGTQSTDKIKGIVLGESKKQKDGRYLTKMNISWASLPILPKMFDVMREKNMRQDYDVDAYCIDDDSIQAKAADKAMLHYLVSDDAKEIMRATKFTPDTPLDPNAMGIQSAADVELYFQTGSYSFLREIACLAACNKTKLVSNYKVIQDGLFDDLIKFAICGGETYIDTVTKTVKMRKADFWNPELGFCPVILPYSNFNNFDDNSRYGIFRTMTIGQVRKENPHLSVAEIRYLAKCFSFLNPSYANAGSSFNLMGGSAFVGSMNNDPINRCKIIVLDSQWLTENTENYLQTDGRSLFKNVNFDYKVSAQRERKGDKVISKKAVIKCTSSWVVGTDIFLKYGQAENVPYYGEDGDMVPKLDGVFSKTGNISLTERCVALQDDIDVNNVKLRNSLACAIPAPRMIIQQGLLDNVFLNNIKVQPEDGLTTFKELGYLFVNAVDDFGKPIFTNSKLVDFLPMGIQEDINVFAGQILNGINNMREVLGIPQGIDGSTPNPYNGARKTELSMQSSNAALYPTFNCFQYWFETSFDNAIKKWQCIAKDSDIRIGYSPLGERNLEVFRLGKDFTNADYNIKVSMGPTDMELKATMDDIVMLKNQGIQTNFQLGITTSEYLMLKEKILSGNPKEAMYVMAKIEAKKIAKSEQQNQQNQKQNALDQQNSAAQAELNKQETARISGSEARKTVIVNDASKRKTAAATQILKAHEKPDGKVPIDQYQQIIHEANQEILPIILQDIKTPPSATAGNQFDEGQPQGPQQQVA